VFWLLALLLLVGWWRWVLGEFLLWLWRAQTLAVVVGREWVSMLADSRRSCEHRLACLGIH